MMQLARQLRPCLQQVLRPTVALMSSDAKLVDVVVNEKTGVATLTMQRPPVNSLSLELMQQMVQELEKLEEDRKCRGIILTSSLPTVFCAGLDIKEMYKPVIERENKFWTAFQDLWLSLYGSSLPTVAAINGHSPAGGCLLALCCEYRVMVAPQFNIGLNETQLGIVAPKWVRETMLRVLPRRQAELALTVGRIFTATEALENGLIDETATDKADAIAKAEKFLADQAKIPAAARKLCKMSMRMDIIEWLHQNRDEDRESFLGFVNQPEQQKIIEQYLQALGSKKAK